MDVRERVGRNVRHHRQRCGLSQEELAHRCELDRTYISGIERGRRNPTVVVLERLAGVLGTTGIVLLGESSIATDPPAPLMDKAD